LVEWGILKAKTKKKKTKGHLPSVLWPAHGLSCVGSKTHGKEFAFAVRLCKNIRQILPPLPCAVQKTHGKDFSPCVGGEGVRQCEFTMQISTVCPLPCASLKNARQSLCHAFFWLCRAAEAHGKPRVSRSV
jgi:hypothetical protein